MSLPHLFEDWCQRPAPYALDAMEIKTVLKRPITFIDSSGYEDDVIDFTTHTTHSWVAWLNRREKKLDNGRWDTSYFLKLIVNSQTILNWEVETYNPFFGCVPVHFNWHGDKFVFVYTEKHHLYGFTFSAAGELINRHVLGVIGDEFCIAKEIALIWPGYSRPKREIMRYRLPNWIELPTISQEEGLELGILIPAT